MSNLGFHLFQWDSLSKRLWGNIYLTDPLRKFTRLRCLHGYIEFMNFTLEITPTFFINFNNCVYLLLSLRVDLILIGFGITFEWEWNQVSDINPLKEPV